MNYEIQNLTRRLVSVHCNSGKTCHLPPGCKHELPEQELTENRSAEKLKGRGLIAIRQLSKTSTRKPAGENIGKVGAKSTKARSAKKQSGKKSQSKK